MDQGGILCQEYWLKTPANLIWGERNFLCRIFQNIGIIEY